MCTAPQAGTAGCGVGLLAHLRAVVASQGRVEEGQYVVIDQTELSAVDLLLPKGTSRLPHLANEHTAHLRLRHHRVPKTGEIIVP